MDVSEFSSYITSIMSGGVAPIFILVTVFFISWFVQGFIYDVDKSDKKETKKITVLYIIISSLIAIGTIFLVTPSMTSEKGMEWMVGVGQLLLVLFAYMTIHQARKSSRETMEKAEESIRASQRIAGEMEIDRRIEHLNKMLSQLYSPLIRNEDRYLSGYDEQKYAHGPESYGNFIDNIRANAYLAGNRLRGPLDALLHVEEKPSTSDKLTHSIMRTLVMEAAKEEYDALLKELERLTNHPVSYEIGPNSPTDRECTPHMPA